MCTLHSRLFVLSVLLVVCSLPLSASDTLHIISSDFVDSYSLLKDYILQDSYLDAGTQCAYAAYVLNLPGSHPDTSRSDIILRKWDATTATLLWQHRHTMDVDSIHSFNVHFVVSNGALSLAYVRQDSVLELYDVESGSIRTINLSLRFAGTTGPAYTISSDKRFARIQSSLGATDVVDFDRRIELPQNRDPKLNSTATLLDVESDIGCFPVDTNNDSLWYEIRDLHTLAVIDTLGFAQGVFFDDIRGTFVQTSNNMVKCTRLRDARVASYEATSALRWACFSADGRQLVVAAASDSAFVVDIATQHTVAVMANVNFHTDPHRISVSPRQPFLVYGRGDSCVLFNLTTLSPVCTVPTFDSPSSPYGQWPDQGTTILHISYTLFYYVTDAGVFAVRDEQYAMMDTVHHVGLSVDVSSHVLQLRTATKQFSLEQSLDRNSLSAFIIQTTEIEAGRRYALLVKPWAIAQRVVLYDVTLDSLVASFVPRYPVKYGQVFYSPRSQHIALVDQANKLYVLDSKTLVLLDSMQFDRNVSAACFSPVTDRLVLAFEDSTIVEFSMTSTQPLITEKSHALVFAMVFDSSGQHIAAYTDRNSLAFFEYSVFDLSYRPFGSFAFSDSRFRGGSTVFRYSAHNRYVLSPSGIIDRISGTCFPGPDEDYSSAYRYAGVMYNDSVLVMSVRNKGIMIYSPSDNSTRFEAIEGVCYAHPTRELIYVEDSASHVLSIYNARSFSALSSIRLGSAISSIQWSDSSNVLCIRDTVGVVYLWSPQNLSNSVTAVDTPSETLPLPCWKIALSQPELVLPTMEIQRAHVYNALGIEIPCRVDEHRVRFETTTKALFSVLATDSSGHTRRVICELY